MAKNIIGHEDEILQFWTDNNIFKKTLEKDSPKGEYVFYDGPPFATGTPHYGHIVASVLKDIVPRYQTMRGYHVNRRWGWDCHGLPIENIIEKKLGFKTKKEIVAYGIDKFNEECRSTVLEYVDEWKKFVPRLGRWADMENPYQTMDRDFMESVWWVFKQLHDKELVYEGYKSMHICPRCETTLSQQEVSEGYKDVKDLSVTAKFELVDEPGTFVLAWTTTPWTLPANVGLAVGRDIRYVKVESSNGSSASTKVEGEKVNVQPLPKFETYIVARSLAEVIFSDREYQILEDVDVSDLIGKKYRPLFDYYLNKNLEHQEHIYTIVAGDFVTTEDGTGVVHIAPAFGEDDMNLGREQELPFIQNVTLGGSFTDEVTDFAGMSVKPIDDIQSTDVAIIKYLAGKGLLFKKEKYEHSYPHCWRCDTPLLMYATSSWFVAITKIKEAALRNAKTINWSPEHIKEGRFGKWLEGARDWSISRQRFWASVMPVWKCENGHTKVLGSAKELEDLSGQTITDLHKHIVDPITFACDQCDSTMKRIPDVLDTWFDSGSMPYAQLHYPFENQELLEANLPAQFIAEGADQTRAWFYYLHVLGTSLFDKAAFQNVIVNGIVLAEDGKKMSKRLKNYPDPQHVIDAYGADALRYYLLSSPVVEAETLNFSEAGVKESLQKTVMLMLNVLQFYQTYRPQTLNDAIEPTHVMDRWILAKLEQFIAESTEYLEQYNVMKATRLIGEFINELSTWYVRRSRDRIKDGDEVAIQTLGFVLRESAKVLAPALPFIAEHVYRTVGGPLESVHLETWPEVDETLRSADLLTDMDRVMTIVERGLAARAAVGVKVRQPLRAYTTNVTDSLDEGLQEVVCDELNIKMLEFGDTESLDTALDENLRREGQAREIIRQVNQLRKELGLTIHDRIAIFHQGLDEVFAQYADDIIKGTLADSVEVGTVETMVDVEGGRIGFIKK